MNRPIITLDAPITSVTLREDRAHVTRKGTVQLPAGPSRLVVRDMAPAMVDRSLEVSTTNETAVMRDARVRRSAGPTERLIESRNQRDAQRSELMAKRANLNKKKEMVARAAELAHTEIALEAARGGGDITAWAGRLSRLDTAEAHFPEKLQALNEALHELESTRTEDKSQVRCSTEIDVDTTEAGVIEIQIEYVTPGAAWRPHHRVTVTEAGKNPSATFVFQAAVWQNTGEDWDGIQLCVSTERSSARAEPPRLSSKPLWAGDGSVEDGDTDDPRVAPVVLEALPGVDDAGEPLRVEAPARVHIASKAQPTRVTLFEFSSNAAIDIIAADGSTAELVSGQLNSSPYAILAGPVDLIKGGGLIGRTSIGHVEAGQAFTLFWGPHPNVRVRRDSKGLHLSNLSDTSLQIRVSADQTVQLSPHARHSVES